MRQRTFNSSDGAMCISYFLMGISRCRTPWKCGTSPASLYPFTNNRHAAKVLLFNIENKTEVDKKKECAGYQVYPHYRCKGTDTHIDEIKEQHDTKVADEFFGGIGHAVYLLAP